MNCAPFDLRDYSLDELTSHERAQVDAHLASCPACRDEVERLRLTRQALLRLKDEEVPRRIAFVSDKVFEPSWTSRLWAVLPRLAFAIAALAVVFFAGQWSARANNAEVLQAIQAMETRHAAEIRNAEQVYRVLVEQLNQLYRREAEMQPAAFRQ